MNLDTVARRRFACPFHKVDPEGEPTCGSPKATNKTGGFENLNRLKTHLKDSHDKSQHCSRCWVNFKNSSGSHQSNFQEHLARGTCSTRRPPRKYWLDEAQKANLNRTQHGGDIERWYRLLKMVVPIYQDSTLEQLMAWYTPWYEPSPTEPHDLSTSPSLILTPMSTPPQPSINIPSTIDFSVAATPSMNQSVLNSQPFGNMSDPFATHRNDSPADEPCLSDSFLFPPCDEATHYEHSPAPALEDTWINGSLNFTHQLHATDHPNDILVGPSSVDYLQDKIKELRIKNYQYREVVNSTLRSLQRLDTEFQMMQRATRLIPSMLRRMIRARTLLSEIESTLNNA